LAVEIRRREPDAAIFGMGGQRLLAGGGELVVDYRGLSRPGVVGAAAVIPRFFGVLRQLIAAAELEKPQALVVIDSPDFNLSWLAPSIKRLGIPIIYYI